MLPHWVLYPTWALCIIVILGCGFMVIWYGMAFGNQKSLEWLGSVTVGLVSFKSVLFCIVFQTVKKYRVRQKKKDPLRDILFTPL